jgi:DNA-binding SARP family transcriptional activator/tetratricopeptide (TPR) repeat protein
MIAAGGVVRFVLLGPLSALDDSGNRMAAAGPRQRVLLAALLMRANSPVPSSVLAEAVWDGAPPPGATSTLRSYVMRVRRALGPEAADRIGSSGLGYLISVNESELDVLQFEALCRDTSSAVSARSWEKVSSTARHALGLWRGTPLADVPSSVLREGGFVSRLEQLHVQLLEERIEADLRVGLHERLVEDLRDLTAQHPLRERFHAQLMLALARGGRRSEALEAYQDARQVLSEELGIEPGPELREMQKKILAGGTELSAPPVKPPDPGQAVVPRQLPAPARHFTGRLAELEALTALLKPCAPGGTVVISAINGMAGVGKTGLAVHAAHRLSERFPDGQLFLDLHGHSDGYPPRSAADALDYFLRSLGVPPQQIPPDLEERAALYRQRLAGSRTLILLDNAMSEAQVRPLLPASRGCLVVVTSRRRLKALDDAQALPLDVLPEADAADLFRAVAGPERVPVDDPFLKHITELCAGLPLALRIAASLLRHRPFWNLQRLAAVLGNQQRVSALNDGERDLGAVLDLSYAQLTNDQRHLFDHLGLVPGPDVDALAAAALADTDLQTAQRLLEDLSDQNLLIEHAPDRFRMHDLVRLYARAHAKDTASEQRETALRRLLDYYLDTALAADRHLTRRTTSFAPRVARPPRHRPDLATKAEAEAWLSTELANLTAAVQYSAADVSPLHCVALSAAMHGYFSTHGPWALAVTVHSTAAEAARRIPDMLAQATALGDLGRMKYLNGDYPGATQSHEQALELSRALTDQLGQASALCELGRLRCLGDDFPGAARLLEQALNLYRDFGDELGEARALITLGLVRRHTADYPSASQALERALRLCRELGDQLGEAAALTDLGRIRAQTGDYPGAARAHQQALEICRHTGDRLGQANALRDLGYLRRLTGDYPGAARALENAVELYRVLGSQLGQANGLNDLGLVYRLTGDLSRAADLHQEALQLYRVLGSQLGQANALNDLGLVRRLAMDLPQAAHAHWQALQLFRKVDDRQGQAEALNRYAAILTATGDPAQALVHHAAALRIAREIASPLDQADAMDGIGESHLGNGNIDDGTTHLRQALAIYRQLGAPNASRVAARLAELGCEDR